jgi:hypothetical protein
VAICYGARDLLPRIDVGCLVDFGDIRKRLRYRRNGVTFSCSHRYRAIGLEHFIRPLMQRRADLGQGLRALTRVSRSAGRFPACETRGSPHWSLGIIKNSPKGSNGTLCYRLDDGDSTADGWP